MPVTVLQIQASQTASIELVCSTMRRQIISRAFYGWLAYCRHLSTVRTHLSGLVNGRITPDCKSLSLTNFSFGSHLGQLHFGNILVDADDQGLTKEKWENLQVDGVISSEMDVYRLVYFGGVQHEIRREVWPYLLGHYWLVKF